ncbi:MAG: HEAT repeat domain-containing protein [Magnetococcales bacterium]|nr:HEAT repeat domain-containing protein [Magnetococcales bacterium]
MSNPTPLGQSRHETQKRRLWSDLLRVLFRINPGEGERVGFMLAYSIALIGGVMITGQMITRSFYLSALPKEAIPFKFILPSIAIVVAVALHSRLTRRFPLPRVILGSFLVIQLAALGFRFLLETDLQNQMWFLLLMTVFFDTIGAIGIIQFWTFAGELFNTREAKRLFGIIAGGSAISSILYGGVIGTMARELATKDLIFFIVGSLLITALSVGHLSRRYWDPPEIAHPPPNPTQEKKNGLVQDLSQDLAEIRQEPLVMVMGILVVVIAITSYITEYQMDLALKEHYLDDSQGMVIFLAQLSLGSGILAAFMQFFLAGRFMERFGVMAALSLLPLFIGLGGMAILATGGALWAVTVSRVAIHVFQYTINDSAFNMLFLPIPQRVRSKVKAVLDGFIKPPVILGLGIVFFLASQWQDLSLVLWSVPLLGFVLYWFTLLFRASRMYVQTLSDSIVMRRMALMDEVVDLNDDTSARVLRQALQEKNHMRVLHALTLVREVEQTDWSHEVAPLTRHANIDIRVEALRYLGERQAEAHLELIREHLSAPHETERGAAITALARIRLEGGLHELEPFLKEAPPRIRGTAVLCMIQYGGLGGLLKAGNELKGMLENEAAQERRIGAWILGELGVESIADALTELLADPDPKVRLEAIRAAAKIASPLFIEPLLPLLFQPVTRSLATQAVVGSVCRDIGRVAHMLADSKLPLAIRAELPRVLELNASPRALEILVSRLDEPHNLIRSNIYQALFNLHRSGYRLPLEASHLEKRLVDELTIAYNRRLLQMDIRLEGIRDPLLVEAVAMRSIQDHDRLLALLALRHPDLPIQDVSEALRGGDDRRRANTLELIDNVASRPVKELLIPYIVSSDLALLAIAQKKLALTSQPLVARLGELTAAEDPWVRSVTVKCIADLISLGQDRLRKLLPNMMQAKQDQHPLVRKTARFALELILLTDKEAGIDPEAFLAEPPGFDDEQTLIPDTLCGIFSSPARRFEMSLSPLETVLFLKGVSFFEAVPGEEIATILPITREVRFQPGERFIEQGEPGESLYIVVEGEVDILVDEKRQPDRITRKGIIGELAILSGSPRAATCQAVDKVVALMIRKADFWELLRERPEVSIGVIKNLLKYQGEEISQNQNEAEFARNVA